VYVRAGAGFVTHYAEHPNYTPVCPFKAANYTRRYEAYNFIIKMTTARLEKLVCIQFGVLAGEFYSVCDMRERAKHKTIVSLAAAASAQASGLVPSLMAILCCEALIERK
jgi:hypothetical protein